MADLGVVREVKGFSQKGPRLDIYVVVFCSSEICRRKTFWSTSIRLTLVAAVTTSIGSPCYSSISFMGLGAVVCSIGCSYSVLIFGLLRAV